MQGIAYEMEEILEREKKSPSHGIREKKENGLETKLK
jgi:hypothetical protein